MTSVPTRGERFALPLALGLIALVFVGALDNGFVNWDDGIYIADNPLVTAPADQPWRDRLLTPKLGYALPIPVLIYGWLWSISSDPWPFHLTSLLVHGLNVGLLFALLRRAGCSGSVGALASVAFGIHPIVVEPVVWATGLKDLLATTGMLLALVGLRHGLGALPGALFALGSKPSSILLAVPLWAVARVRSPIDPPRRKAMVAVVVVAALGAALTVFTMSQETETLRTSAREPFSPWVVASALGLQIKHIVAPGTLAPRYVYASTGPLEIGLGIAAAVGALWLFVRWARTRDPRLPWLTLAGAAYLPVSNLHPLERFTADSYFYVPWLGIVGCLALTWPSIEQAVRSRGPSRLRLVRWFLGLVYVGWAAMTAWQVEVWTDSRTLWGDCYVAQPTDPETIYRYGDALGRAGELREELALYLEHEDELEGSRRIPVVLPVYYERAGELDRAQHWYATAFSSPIEQDEGMYWYYVEFVGRFPDRHAHELDDALRYALIDYVQSGRLNRLDARQRENLVPHAKRLGLPSIAKAMATAS